MSRVRVHLRDERGSSAFPVGICGTLGHVFSTDPHDVTCALCRRAMGRVAEAVAAARVVEALTYAAPAVLDGPGQSEVGLVGRRAIAQSVAGEVVTIGYRWPSAHAAIVAWATARDAPRSVASSSAPDRFGRGAVGEGGGGGRTTPTGTQDDFLDVEAALERACTAMTVGSLTLDARTVRLVAEARMCGVPRENRIVGRKGTWFDRHGLEASDIGQRVGLTRHQVGLVVRRVRLAMAELLASKGLVPPRSVAREAVRQRVDAAGAVGHDTEEATMPPYGYDLEGWKEIGSLIGRSEDTAQRMASRGSDPLPVSRFGTRVVARRSDVLAWLSRQVREAVA